MSTFKKLATNCIQTRIINKIVIIQLIASMEGTGEMQIVDMMGEWPYGCNFF